MAKDVVATPAQPPRLVLSTPRKDPAPYKLPWANAYTEEIANRICDEIANGRILNRICIEEPWAPSMTAARMWMMDYPEFEQAYKLAVHIRADTFAFETVELADNAIDGVNIESTRLQIGARQWLAGKIRPADYGNRAIVETKVEQNVNMTGQLNVAHLSMEQILLLESTLRQTIEGDAVRQDDDDEE